MRGKVNYFHILRIRNTMIWAVMMWKMERIPYSSPMNIYTSGEYNGRTIGTGKTIG
jgi:hypothetical protein